VRGVSEGADGMFVMLFVYILASDLANGAG
jgi:hypothetical protein